MTYNFDMRLSIGHFAVAVLLMLISAQWVRAQTTPPSGAVVIRLTGEIDDFARDNLFHRFQQARAMGVHTVILKLDTPGGLVTSGLNITQFLRSLDDLHVIAYVHNEAYSAGSMIAMACNEIVMEPGAMIGDCAPIVFTDAEGLKTMGETERAKAESPILADFYASAQRNGYDPLLVSSMVSIKHEVHWLQSPEGVRKFVDENEAKDLLSKGWKPVAGVPDPVNRGSLLTVDSSLAKTLGISKATYSSIDALAAARSLHVQATLEPSAGEMFIRWLSSTLVRGVLIFVLIQAMYIVFSHPGHGMAETIAAVALSILILVPLLTGYASWLDITLILCGIALMALDIFVIPGHFLPALIGLGMFLFGLILTFVGPEPGVPGWSPDLPETWGMLQTGLLVVAAAMVASIVVSLLLSRYIGSLPYFGKLVLTTTSPQPPRHAATLDAPLNNPWPPVGTVGVAVTDLHPGGSAEFPDPAQGENRIADVISESGYVSKGSAIAVRELRGAYAVVRAVPTETVAI
jgi:membrane-bound serine protease (ClpP class)